MNKIKSVAGTRIYLDTNTLFDEILNVTSDFPRFYKYSVGLKMQDFGVELLRDIAAAYINASTKERIQALTNFQVKFETLKFLMRKAGEREWIKGKGHHAHIIELMDMIAKQSNAWKSSLVKREQPEPESQD